MSAEQTPDIETQAAKLREAAALMRERAEAADALGKIADTITTSTCSEFADHIASWHPLVAFAVADWLDLQARRLDGVAPSMILDDHPAVAVARAYLGESA